MSTLITRGKAQGKALVIAGCVPQGDKKLKDLQGLSVLGRFGEGTGLNIRAAGGWVYGWELMARRSSCGMVTG